MGNIIERASLAVVVFILGIVGLWVGYPLINNIFSSLVDVDPILQAIAWIAFLILIVLALAIAPIREIFARDDE